MAAETREYIDEVRDPSLLSAEELSEGVLAFGDLVARLDQQGAHWSRLLQRAELTEPSEEVRGHFEENRQTIRALRREVTDVERELSDVVRIVRQLEGVVARLHAAQVGGDPSEHSAATPPTPEAEETRS